MREGVPMGDREHPSGSPAVLPIREKGNNMSIKLKVLGLGLLAMLATSAFAVVNASALSNGHFTAEPPTDHVIVKGTETVGTPHRLHFNEVKNEVGHPTTGLSITCTHASYHGTLEGAAATTTTAVRVRPHYTECSTNGEPPHNVEVVVDPSNTGCGTNVFEFTSGGNGTVHVNCHILIKHPNCGITIDKQTLSGITYDTVVEQNKHALTMTVDVKTIVGTYHSGLCVFLGTTHYFEMTGSVTVFGEDTAGNRVGITHTTP